MLHCVLPQSLSSWETLSVAAGRTCPTPIALCTPTEEHCEAQDPKPAMEEDYGMGNRRLKGVQGMVDR